MLPIFKLSETTESHKNLAYFSTIISSVKVEGPITASKIKTLYLLAAKLKISEENSKKIIETTSMLTTEPLDSNKDRIVFLYDFLKLIDTLEINEEEVVLIHNFTEALGFSSLISQKVVSKSIDIFRTKNGSTDYFTQMNTFLKTAI